MSDSESSERMPMVRLASSCAWKVPSRLVKKPSGSAVAAAPRGMGATLSVGVGSGAVVGDPAVAAPAVLALDLAWAVGLLDLGDLSRRHPAARGFDQEIAE